MARQGQSRIPRPWDNRGTKFEGLAWHGGAWLGLAWHGGAWLGLAWQGFLGGWDNDRTKQD